MLISHALECDYTDFDYNIWHLPSRVSSCLRPPIYLSGGNFVQASPGLLLRTTIPASTSLGKMRFAKSRSSITYFGRVHLTELALGSRSIECSTRSVVLMSRTILAEQSFHVYARRFAWSILSVESATIPILMPLSLRHSSTSLALCLIDGHKPASNRSISGLSANMHFL